MLKHIISTFECGTYKYTCLVVKTKTVIIVILDLLSHFELKGVKEIQGKEILKTGSYGFVFDVKHKGKVFTAKKALSNSLTVEERMKVVAKFTEECILLSQLHHPNIVKFIGVYYGDAKKIDLILVMEKLKCNLVEFLAEKPKADLQMKLSILKDVAGGLVYLHEHEPPVIHKGLTAVNVLLADNNRAKIANVGVSKLMDALAMKVTRHMNEWGHVYYMPPETSFDKACRTPKLDIFSFGHLTLHFIIGYLPIVFEIPHRERKKGIVEQQKRNMPLEVMGQNHCLYDLTIKCLMDDPSRRPSAHDLVVYIESQTQVKTMQGKFICRTNKEIICVNTFM